MAGARPPRSAPGRSGRCRPLPTVATSCSRSATPACPRSGRWRSSRTPRSRSGGGSPVVVVDGVRDDGELQLLHVEELEAREERVALVDLGVADVHVAVGGELLLHLVQVVL